MTAKGGTLPGVAALFVFLTAFVAYALTASPVMGWLDSPEFVAASACLGVPHSPGHPLPVLLGKLGALLPVGDVTMRINLMSALAAAGAAVAVQRAGARVARIVAPTLGERTHELGAAALALGFALSWSVWFQGERAEVYALAGFFLAAFMAEMIAIMTAKPHDPRAWYAAALWAGLALATHHFIALTVVLPAALFALARRPGVRIVAMSAVLVVLGLAAFAYLPVRAARHPEVNWGAPYTAERFAWTVSARAFHKAAAEDHVSTPGRDAAHVVATLAEQSSWPLALAMLVGLYLGVRSRRRRMLALCAGSVMAAGMAGRVLVGFDPEIPDHHGYLMPALAALFLLSLAGFFALAALLSRARPRWQNAVSMALVAGLAVLAPVQIGRFGHAASLARARASDELAHWQLAALPPGTLLLSSYFQTSFRLWALRSVEAARPDVSILDRSFLTYPGAAAEATRAYPELAALINAPLRAGAPTPIAMLAHMAEKRPVMVELHPNLEPAVDPWLLPHGPFAQLSAAPPSPAERDRAERTDAQLRGVLVERIGQDLAPGDRRGLRDALLWHDVVRLRLFCRQSRLRAARATLEDALQLAPGDSTLLDLATRCGLTAFASPDSPGPRTPGP